jgi:hypothetical protein
MPERQVEAAEGSRRQMLERSFAKSGFSGMEKQF